MKTATIAIALVALFAVSQAEVLTSTVFYFQNDDQALLRYKFASDNENFNEYGVVTLDRGTLNAYEDDITSMDACVSGNKIYVFFAAEYTSSTPNNVYRAVLDWDAATGKVSSANATTVTLTKIHTIAHSSDIHLHCVDERLFFVNGDSGTGYGVYWTKDFTETTPTVSMYASADDSSTGFDSKLANANSLFVHATIGSLNYKIFWSANSGSTTDGIWASNSQYAQTGSGASHVNDPVNYYTTNNAYLATFDVSTDRVWFTSSTGAGATVTRGSITGSGSVDTTMAVIVTGAAAESVSNIQFSNNNLFVGHDDKVSIFSPNTNNQAFADGQTALMTDNGAFIKNFVVYYTGAGSITAPMFAVTALAAAIAAFFARRV